MNKTVLPSNHSFRMYYHLCLLKLLPLLQKGTLSEHKLMKGISPQLPVHIHSCHLFHLCPWGWGMRGTRLLIPHVPASEPVPIQLYVPAGPRP